MEKLNLSPTIEDNNNANQASEPVFFGETKDGARVYDRNDSHFHQEGGLTPELLNEALSKIDTEDRSFIKEKVDFDHPIGERTCVNIGPEDDVVMVYRKGRSGQTPMVKNRQAEPCNSVIVLLKKKQSPDERVYETVTSYIGEGSPREPWDPGIASDEERQECEKYWNTHALIYNDDLIDWEKTKAYEFMSEPAKRAELIRQKVLYAGLFINPEELHQKKQPTLEKVIEHPHVTTAFKPDTTQLHLDSIGSSARIYAIGYGNNGENEGLLVKVEAEDPELQEACNALKTPHITLSTSKNGQAKNTAFLNFTPLDEPFELTGEYGLFAQGKVVKTR